MLRGDVLPQPCGSLEVLDDAPLTCWNIRDDLNRYNIASWHFQGVMGEKDSVVGGRIGLPQYTIIVIDLPLFRQAESVVYWCLDSIQ